MLTSTGLFILTVFFAIYPHVLWPAAFNSKTELATLESGLGWQATAVLGKGLKNSSAWHVGSK